MIEGNGVLSFANYVQDHMVLERAPQRAIVWGFGDPSALTNLTVNDKTYTTISRAEPANKENESIWSVTLDPVSDEGPFDIHVSQPLANGTLVTITLHDILFGDVWICSGQSNMQLTVSLIYNATEEVFCSLLKVFIVLVFILGINMILVIASHVLVLPLHMGNK